MPHVDLEIVLAGQPVRLMPERAIAWPGGNALMVADLHWGKIETFTAHGVPLPGGMLPVELDRLSVALRRSGAKRLLILGDLIHAREGITPAVISTVAAWRETWPDLECVLVRGNHDRHLPRMPAEWRLEECHGTRRESPFAFVHEPQNADATADGDAHTFCGHTHPMVYIAGRGDAVRLPCFRVGERVTVLPAFSDFSDGSSVKPLPTDRVFAVAPGTVVEVPNRAAVRPDPRDS